MTTVGKLFEGNSISLLNSVSDLLTVSFED